MPLAPNRAEPEGRPTVIALPVPRPYGRNDKIAKKAIDQSLPDAVAAFLDWLFTRSGWTVSELPALTGLDSGTIEQHLLDAAVKLGARRIDDTLTRALARVLLD